jgi:plasmid rolling circle replication initiator protein Rep
VRIEFNEQEEPTALLKGARVCNRRLCPFCEWRRTRAWRKRLYGGLEAFSQDHSGYRGLFLTLTVRNCPLEELGAQLQEMNRSWQRLKAASFFPTPYWFRRTEVTVGYAPGSASITAHPHFHALLLVRPSYFSHGYVKQLEWQRQWQMAARLDYPPVIDVRAAKSRSMSGGSNTDGCKEAVLEAAKYAAKATQLMELGPAITELHWQLKNKRMYSLSRKLSAYIRSGEVTLEEMTDKSDISSSSTPALEGVASWFEDSQEYLFTHL